MNSFVDMFQWIIQVMPALTFQLLVILFVIKPTHRWFGSRVAYRLWLLPLIWFPFAWVIAPVLSALISSINSQSSLAYLDATILLTSFEAFDSVLPNATIFIGAKKENPIDFWDISTGFWLCGFAILTFLQITKSLSLQRYILSLKRAINSKQVQAHLQAAGFQKEFEIKYVSNLTAPAMYGIRKQVLLLPSNFESSYDSDQILSILRHEFVHYSRNDNLINSILLFCKNLFWFNPIVWIAYSRFRLDQELSCDFAALNDSDQRRRNKYAEALLSAISGKKYQHAPEVTAWGGIRCVKERTLMLNRHHRQSISKMGKLIWFGLIITIGTMASSFLRSQDFSANDFIQAENIPDSFLVKLNEYDQATETSLPLDHRENTTIPSDSEYIAFIVDTSGSMVSTPNSWETVSQIIPDILQSYPNLRGIQIANDMGTYLFTETRGEWLALNSEQFATIGDALSTWNPRSNSSPIEGIAEILNNLATSYSNVSVYVIGDDLRQEVSVQAVIENIEQYNKPFSTNGFIARIHTVMLPNIFYAPESMHHEAYKYANLMRAIASRNGGSFTLIEY